MDAEEGEDAVGLVHQLCKHGMTMGDITSQRLAGDVADDLIIIDAVDISPSGASA